MTTLSAGSTGATTPNLDSIAASLSQVLAEATPQEIVRAALDQVGRDKLALVSSFGSESAALL